MGLHNDFSWRYTKALLPASSEQRAHAATQLCWFGFQVEARKCSFLRRNPSPYHFKAKYSLVSRLWKCMCTEFWWLSKRRSQNFEHFLVCCSKQKGNVFYFQTALDRQTVYKPMYSQNHFSKHLADVPLPLLSFYQHNSSRGTHSVQIQRSGTKRVHDLEASSYPACALIHPVQISILPMIVPIKEMNPTKIFPACLPPSICLDSRFFVFF